MENSTKTYKTLEAVARAYGKAHGVQGRAGGWLYRNGRRLAQGWVNYGYMLVDGGLVTPLDADGQDCRNRAWRRNAKTFAIRAEPAR